MVEVSSSMGGRGEDLLQGFMGRTQGKLRKGLRSVLGSASTSKANLFNGISSKIESALSSRSEGQRSLSVKSSECVLEDPIEIEAVEELDTTMETDLPSPSALDALPVACGPDPYERLTYKVETVSSGSEGDGYGPSTSLETSAGQKFYVHSGSEGSVLSWASSLSLDSQTDEAAAEAAEFMRGFVALLFHDSSAITQEQKARFGKLAQDESGRLWFSRFVNAQRVHCRQVTEATFFSLAQFFAIVLFECADSDDFGPAKSLMNMCFTFYHEVKGNCSGDSGKQYVYSVLQDQPIFHSLRFWNAAFFEALQCERSLRPVATRDEVTSNNLEALIDERTYQENITFGQLGTFTSNMHAFGLSRDLCLEFLRKQCTIASLSSEQQQILRDNLENLYQCSSSRMTR